MAACGGKNNLVVRRFIDDLIDISGERSPLKNKVADFNRLIAVVAEKIHGKEIDLEMLEAEVRNAVSGFWKVYSEVLLHILSFGIINWFSDYMDEYNHVKENKEKNKIKTKPDENGKGGKAWQCRRPITVKKAEKKRKYRFKGPNMQTLKKYYIQDKRQGLILKFTQSYTTGGVSAKASKLL
nr:hypothetical protein [Tanacetum cinerariifolium]